MGLHIDAHVGDGVDAGDRIGLGLLGGLEDGAVMSVTLGDISR